MAIQQSKPKTGGTGGGSGSADQTTEKARNMLLETVTELKKTTWPTREEATRLTLLVIGVIVVLGTYMGTLDWVLSALVTKFGLIK